MQRVHLIISGDVQGIGFRSWVREKALELGLVGWVKNRDDGGVEVTWEEATNKFISFDVVY